MTIFQRKYIYMPLYILYEPIIDVSLTCMCELHASFMLGVHYNYRPASIQYTIDGHEWLVLFHSCSSLGMSPRRCQQAGSKLEAFETSERDTR